MANQDESRAPHGHERDLTTNRLEQHSSVPGDLPDSPEDAEKLKGLEATLDLPDVSDIPGQENITVPSLGELADVTASSDDEEGKSIFENADHDLDEDTALVMGTEADVSPEERTTLARTDYLRTGDDERLQRASMDSTDFQGEALNESSFGQERSGDDLDIPDETDETETDAMGQGDEENKLYSMGSDDNDNMVEGTP